MPKIVLWDSHPSLGFLSVLAGKDVVGGIAGPALLVGLSCASDYVSDL